MYLPPSFLGLDLHTVARAWLDRMTSLQHTNPSARLRAALAIGTTPDPSYIGELLERCAVEPDFNVRETLTWALMRHPESLTVPRLVEQVQSGNNQARSQALHTLSKIKGPNSWPVITPDLLSDPDDEVARSAWRAAVVLVPQAQRLPLATMLSTQLGRGSREMQLSRCCEGLIGMCVPELTPSPPRGCSEILTRDSNWISRWPSASAPSDKIVRYRDVDR